MTMLEVERPVQVDGLKLGVLQVRADTSHAWNNLLMVWLAKLVALTGIFAVSYFMLVRTSSYVLGPVQRLLNAIRGIIDNGDYSLRVEKSSDDELGELTSEFNLMLANIEDRDAQLKRSNEALSQVQEPIMLRDVDLNCEYVNPAFTSLFGYTFEELEGTTFSLEVENESAEDNTIKQAEAYAIAKRKGVYRGEFRRQTKDGRILPLQRHISPVKDNAGVVKGYVTVLSDITQQKDAEAHIWRQANFDALTGLPNRLMFTERLKRDVARVKITQTPLALMFLDLDHFKEINDTLGHDMGDSLLKEVSRRILNCVRGGDAVGSSENVARLGGDEFTIILSNLKKGVADAELVAKRVLEQLEMPFQLGKEVVYISASIGIAETYPDEALDTDTLIKYADIAMYDAKQKGRNRYSQFSKTMLIEAQKRRRLINDIHKALERDEFYLVYQPIVDIRTNKIVKAEALIRWRHPDEGLVNPVDFISVAEDAGLIEDIGNWVFREAVQQVSKWRGMLSEDFQIGINKSPVQLHSMDDQVSWFDYLEEFDVPGSSIVVEITEGIFLNKNAVVTDKLRKFREAGMQISLDDFGTGYSSLSYLLEFEIDFIKIDKSFVKNLSINKQDLVLCEAMIVMAHKLGMEVVAEGIETQAQMSTLSEAGCDFAQGYLLSKPLESQDFEKFFTEYGMGNYMESA